MTGLLEGSMTPLPHVPDLSTLVALTRRAGAGSDAEALRLVQGGLQLLSETWSDALRIRLVAAAPVDVARWLVAPTSPGRAGGSVVDVDRVGALASDVGCARPMAEAALAALAEALSDILPATAPPAGFSPQR